MWCCRSGMQAILRVRERDFSSFSFSSSLGVVIARGVRVGRVHQNSLLLAAESLGSADGAARQESARRPLVCSGVFGTGLSGRSPFVHGYARGLGISFGAQADAPVTPRLRLQSVSDLLP